MNDHDKLELELLVEEHKRDMWRYQGWNSGFGWGALVGVMVGALVFYALITP